MTVTLHALRRRHLILLVPVVNFVFLFLYVVSPTSLPRLPQFLTGFRDLTDDLPYLWDLRKQVEGVRLTPLPDHLITTYRPKHLHLHNQEDADDDQQQEAVDRDNSTKYLTFLPHSGFHNQRTELENALLLARLLNRTLIMPKVYLGPPMPWLEFRHLHARLLYQTKIGLDHCRAILEYRELDVVKLAPTPPPRPPPQPQAQPQASSDQSQQQQQQQQQQQEQQQQQDQQQSVMHHHHPSDASLMSVAAELLYQDVAVLSPADGEPLSVDTRQLLSTNSQSVDSDMFTNDATQNLTSEGYDDGYHGSIEAENFFGEEEEAAEEDDLPSWIEVPDSDEADKIRVATGDRVLDLNEDDDGKKRDSEDWEGMEDGEEAGYEEEEALVGNRVGIMDVEGDDDDLEPDWRPEVFTLPDYLRQQYQSRRSRHRSRLMAQRMKAPGAVGSLPLYRPLGSTDRKGRGASMWKRSLPQADEGLAGTEPGTRQPLLKRQMAPPPSPPPPPAQQPQPQLETKPRFKWNPLPAECLQYETWTMADWDLFFDLNPLRRYVRVLTRESITMEYLGAQFGLEMPKIEDPPSNSTDLASNSTEFEDLFNSTEPASQAASFDTVLLPTPTASLLSDALRSDSGKGAGFASSESESESDDDDKDRDQDDEEDKKVEEDKDKDDEEDKKVEEDNNTPDDDADTDDDERKRPLLRSEGDVLFFDDANLYDYRFTEDPRSVESKRTRSKYLEEFTVDWLAQRPERLIHLGSIFGSGRVIIETLQSKAWLQMIRDHLILRTDILQTTSQRIVDKIRGQQDEEDRPERDSSRHDPYDAGFVGVHIRMSDGHFSLSARDTIETIRQELMWQMGITDGQSREKEEEDASGLRPSSDDMGSRPTTKKRRERLSIEQCRTRAIRHRQVLKEQLVQLERQRQEYLEQQRLQQQQQQQQQEEENQQGHQHGPSAEHHDGSSPRIQAFEPPTFARPMAEAPGRRSNGRFTPIYLATDAYHPRSNPIFDRLFETFECVFTLDDFAEDLAGLKRFRNPEDGTLMTKFLIPMVDAMVVAKAGAFFGTPASTFSTYIQKQLRPAYTGLYD
ncbi:hypothetical protein BGZ70_002468 [Mortierella alpina]|uniref:O-fucosyltransferase family protein n=1 Tax=Mortierella alpina TaxID=64518 RepID=A0A9P6JFD3_MORAP|nr:hypothetical protein BGZ70_002468 [Mortierella alpina]